MTSAFYYKTPFRLCQGSRRAGGNLLAMTLPAPAPQRLRGEGRQFVADSRKHWGGRSSSTPWQQRRQPRSCSTRLPGRTARAPPRGLRNEGARPHPRKLLVRPQRRHHRRLRHRLPRGQRRAEAGAADHAVAGTRALAELHDRQGWYGLLTGTNSRPGEGAPHANAYLSHRARTRARVGVRECRSSADNCSVTVLHLSLVSWWTD